MASKALSLFLLPSGSAGIRHAANSPQFELIPIPVAIASKLQRSQPVIKFGANLLPNRFIHSLRRQPERPVHAVDAQIGSLNRVRHIGRYEKRRRYNPLASIPSGVRLNKVAFKLTYKFPVEGLVCSIHYQETILPLALKEVEEPFQQENLVLPEHLLRRPGRFA